MNVNPDLNLNFAQRHLPFKNNSRNNFPSLMFNMNKSNKSNLLLKATPMINSFFNSQNKNNNLNESGRDKIGISINDNKIKENINNTSNSSSNKKRNSNNNGNGSKYNSSSFSKNSNKNKMGNKSNSSKILNFSGSSNSRNLSKKPTKKHNKKTSKKASKRSSKNSNSKDKDKQNEINTNMNNNYNDEQKNNENNIQRNKKHQLTLSQIRVYQRNNTINNTNVFEFKSLLNKASKINFSQNKIKLNLGNLSPTHSKKNLPVIRNKKDNKNHPKYVYSYEENSDSNYNNNILFLSKFSTSNNDESNNLKLVKCVKQKGSELFLSPMARNINRNYSKDYLVTLNRLKFTSSNFCINSTQSNKFIKTSNTFKYFNRNYSENMANEKFVSNFNINNSRNNNKLKTHMTNTLSDINLNIYSSSINTFSSKNLPVSNKNSSKNNLGEFKEIKKKKNIEIEDSNNETDFIKEINAFSDDEIKSCSTNKYGIPIPRRKRRENTQSMNSTIGKNLKNNFDSIGMHSSKNLFNRPKKYSFRHMLSEKNLVGDKGFLNLLKGTNDNNDYIQDNSGKNIYAKNSLFKHSRQEFKKMKYKEKDYINHRKEKLENIIANDEFTNRSIYNDKLILIKKEFLDKDISNFMENKSKELIPKNFFDTEREILFDEKNKEKEDYLYKIFKEPDKYIFNLIYEHCNLNKIINKKYFKHFYPSNKIKKIQTNVIHINETNKLNYNENKNFIIQFIKEKYNFYSYIYKTVIYRRDLKKLISRRMKSKVIKNKKDANEFEEDRKCSESYNILKISLYFNGGLYKFLSKIEKPFGQIEYKRKRVWHIIERGPTEKQMNKKQKRASINLGKGGRRQSTYLTLLKSFKQKESDKDKEKPKIEKKSTCIFPGKMRMSISGDLNIKPKDFGSSKENSKKKSIASSKSYKFRDSNGLDKIKNSDIIIEERSIDESSSHSVIDDAKSKKLNKSRNFLSKKLSSYSSSESSDSSSWHLIIKDFEEMDEKINKFKFSTNKQMFGRNDISKRESLNTRLNKLLQEENYYKKNNFNNEKKNEIIIKLAGYDTLTKEAMSIKKKELEEKSPTVQLFNKFVLIIEKRKENLFEELLNEEEKNYMQQKKNFNEFLNMQQSYTGNTLLIYAAQNGVKNIAQSLLMRKCDPNIQNIFGNTALHLAYKTNNMALVYLLKGFGALENIKNESGLRPVQMTFFEESIL